MSNYQHERGWLDSEIWGNAPYSERDAWSWLIGEAAFKDRTVPVASTPVTIYRGQVTASLRFMAQKWQWDKERVRRFLKKLEKWAMITIETANKTGNETGQTVLTICNYSKYQSREKKTKTLSEPQNKTEARQQRDKLEDIQYLQKEEEPPDGVNPQRLSFEGDVLRLNESDWGKWRVEFQITDDQLGRLLSERDEFLRKLNETDARRERWWIPTRKWLANEAENLRKSKKGRSQ